MSEIEQCLLKVKVFTYTFILNSIQRPRYTDDVMFNDVLTSQEIYKTFPDFFLR